VNNAGKPGITRAAYLLAMLLVVSGFHSFSFYNLHIENRTIRFREGSLDFNFYTAYENRFAAVKEFLPAHGTIGYISDEFNRDDDRQYALATTRLLATRYSLAPLIVADDATGTEFIIGDFHSPCASERLTQMGLIPVRQLENGVMLLRREAK
jgi:hypothetical protein